MKYDIYQPKIIRNYNKKIDINNVKKLEKSIRRSFDREMSFQDNIYCCEHELIKNKKEDIFEILMAIIKMTYYEGVFSYLPTDEYIYNMVIDYVYCAAKKPIIFVESKELIEILYEMTFDNMNDDFTTPLNGVVSYSFNNDTIIDKMPVNALRVIDKYIPYKYYTDVIVKMNLGLETNLFKDIKDDNVFRIDSNVGYGSRGKEDILYFMKLEINEEEKGIEEAIKYSKLVYMLSKYIEACPEELMQGLPDKYEVKKENTNQICWRLKKPRKLSDVKRKMKAHEVRSHKRRLKSTRYKREPDGSIREITVKKHWVGGPITPYTLKGK